jgi:hypothetical protein
MIKVITNRHPQFLKAAYANPEVDLQNHAGFIDPLEKFIEWDGSWVVREMTAERVPRFVARCRELETAIYKAKQ